LREHASKHDPLDMSCLSVSFFDNFGHDNYKLSIKENTICEHLDEAILQQKWSSLAHAVIATATLSHYFDQ
jgi:hypothetical protein